MDTLGALALATEPPNDGLLERPPVGRGANFITKTMWRNIIGQSIYQLIVLAILNFDGKRILGIYGSDATEVLNTLIFNSFVFCQVPMSWYLFCWQILVSYTISFQSSLLA
jgi:Ca2+-transporting ATPase